MGKEILPVESIYINGEDVSDEVFSSIAIHMDAPVDQGPAESVPSGEAGMDSIPLPDEEPLENYALPPDDVPLPSLDDIPPEAKCRCRRKQKVCRKWICLTYFPT